MILSNEPEWIKPYVVARAQLTFSGKDYEYLIVSSRLAQSLNAPSVFITAKSGILAVSDNYPIHYRELAFIHELTEYGNDPVPEYACVDALKQELSIAQSRGIDMKEYIEFRLQFFSILVDYYEKKDRHPSEDPILVRLRHSLDYLKEL